MTREGSGNEASGPVELLDGTKLAVSTLSGGDDADTGKRPGEKSALRGAALLGYENTNGLRFLQETVKAEVLRADTGEVLGSGELPLKNQTPFSTDETMVYIPFSEPVRGTAQEDLEVRFSSEGLTRNGIFFSGQKTAGSADAEEEQQTVAARLYYEKKSWSPGNAVITWLLAAAAGLKIVGIEAINEAGTYSYDSGVNNFRAKGMDVEAAEAETVVQAAKIQVNAQVNITFKAE